MKSPLVSDTSEKISYESMINGTPIMIEFKPPKRKRKRCCGKCQRRCHRFGARCSTCVDWGYIGNSIYDLLNIFITIADIITDTLVIYNFYDKKQMTFFWIGLVIVIIAQICYAIAFVVQYVENIKTKPCAAILWFIVALIFSPIMSFIFFFTSDQSRCLSRILTKHTDLHVPVNRAAGDGYQSFDYYYFHDNKDENNETKKIGQWVALKFRKHLGFIIESVCEAFPQVGCFFCALYSINNKKDIFFNYAFLRFALI